MGQSEVTEPQEPWIGSRARIGVVIPSTNIAVEYDCGHLPVSGVTWHFGRFFTPQTDLSSDATFIAFLEGIRETIPHAVDALMSAGVTHMMMGMSAETFWGGVEGNEEFLAQLRARIGGGEPTTGANAMVEALGKFGAKRIAVLSPYQPVGDTQVKMFFEGSGFEVVRQRGLCCQTATSIAETPRRDVLRVVLDDLEGDDVDAIVQVGTNLSTADFFPTLEVLLAKPCIPINVATAWRALRASGVNDRIHGRGRLLEEH